MNDKSAHNSYAAIIGEGGLLTFVPFIGLIFFNFYKFVVHYSLRSRISNAFYWSFLGGCVHMFFISAILNVFAWFLIGIVTAMSALNRRDIIRLQLLNNEE